MKSILKITETNIDDLMDGFSENHKCLIQAIDATLCEHDNSSMKLVTQMSELVFNMGVIFNAADAAFKEVAEMRKDLESMKRNQLRLAGG